MDEASNTASRYGIMSIPTLAVFKEGKIVESIIGIAPKQNIEIKIKQFID